MRKIIQITSCENGRGGYTLTALCDDGSLWEQENNHSSFSSWKELHLYPILETKEQSYHG